MKKYSYSRMSIILNIIFLPILSAILCGFFGRLLGYSGAKLVSTTLISTTCLLSYYAFYVVGFLKNPYYVVLGS